MSRIDEKPAFCFKQDYDLHAKRKWVPMEGVVAAGRNHTVNRRQSVPLNDDINRRCVEGILSIKSNWDRYSAHLE